MAHHDPAITNCQAFWNEFFQWADAEAYDWQTILLRFYSEEFPLVGKDVVPNPASARVVQLLVEKGYPVVLATMPYFPLPAVGERLGWANVDKGAFARITHYENSRASKPERAESQSKPGLTETSASASASSSPATPTLWTRCAACRRSSAKRRRIFPPT